MPEIPAEPFPFPWQPGKLALVVIDMQRDFVEPGGFGHSLGNDVARLQAIVPTLRRLMDAFRAAGLPIVHTRECHRARPRRLPARQAPARQPRPCASATRAPWAAS